MCAVTVKWYDGGLKPSRPEELEDGRMMGTNGTLFVGDKGKILDGRIIPESKQKEYAMPEKTIKSSPGHYQEWIAACKGGEPAGSCFDWAGPLTEVVLLGNIALRVELKEQLSKAAVTVASATGRPRTGATPASRSSRRWPPSCTRSCATPSRWRRCSGALEGRTAQPRSWMPMLPGVITTNDVA